MHLADRLAVRKSGYGWYSYSYRIKSQSYIGEGYASLIRDVLDRYARRFGEVNDELALKLEVRLARKYNGGHSRTLSLLRDYFKCGYRYPRDRALGHDAILRELKDEYEDPSGEYCPLDPDGAVQLTQCVVCGKKIPRWTIEPGGRFKTTWKHENRQLICLDPRCSRIAKNHQKCKSKPQRLALLILEVLDDNGSKGVRRSLEAAFIQNPRRRTQ